MSEERWSHLGGYMDQLCREGISGCACLVYEGEAERFRQLLRSAGCGAGTGFRWGCLYRIAP
ncbi:MAG: hypothetical protein V8S98_03005 [Lachnospiraceae bacterium]